MSTELEELSSDEDSGRMKFDEIVQLLGDFGTYQKRVYFLLCLASMSCGIQIMVSVFNMGHSEHRCAIPGLENDSYIVANEEHAKLINETIPWDSNRGDSGGYSQCYVWSANGTSGDRSLTRCQRWVYDESQFRTTVISKFDLVCENEMARSHARMIMMGGLLLGAIGTGVVADIVGRKLALMGMVALHAASSIGVAWADTLVIYVILRFLTGISISGLFLAIFVLGMELVGPSKRMVVGIVVEVFWAAGVLILGVIAYFIREWEILQMVVSFPILLFFTYCWLIPESPRWLLAKGQHEKAESIIRHAARVNGVTIPEKVFDGMVLEENSKEERMTIIFKSPRFMIRLVVLCYNWLVCAMVYYGLSLNSGNLAGNLYVNFELMSLVEIMGYVICLLGLNRVGRKLLHITCLIIGGGACLSTIFTVLYADKSLEWINIVLALVGKCGAAAAFAIIYIYSAELFPTVLRNSLMGVTCLFARAGGMISPYIADLDKLLTGQLGKALPLIVFGATAVAGGIMCFILPETLNKPLPETLENAVDFGRASKRLRRHAQDVNDCEHNEDKPLQHLTEVNGDFKSLLSNDQSVAKTIV
ncbi:organic cation transporter protein [Biomphalaria glabrata]|nr:organic cation transporter protein [Biomphalaria glabrata]